MADQVEIVANKDRVLEGSNLPVTAYFRTRSSAAADTPDNVYYRVHCLTTNQEITAWTSVSAASSVSITLSGANTDIKDKANRYERKQIQVAGDKDLSNESRGALVYTVENLSGVT